MFGSTFGQQANFNPNNDLEVTQGQPNSDGISALAWSPKANYLVASSWDNQLRLWEIVPAPPGRANRLAQTQSEAPPLCTTWHGDGSTVFFAGCDSKVKCWNPQSATPPSVIGTHNAPVKTMHWIDSLNCLLTGGWDGQLKYWDGRQSNPVCVLNTKQGEKIYCSDVKDNLCVIGTSEKNVYIIDLTKPNVFYKQIPPPLKHQLRCIACFPDKTGFAVGSIEGRVSINHVDDKDASKNFAFKCHREGNDVYAVNSISFHPIHSTFATTGSDGRLNFWDKDSKQRLKQHPPSEPKLNQQLPPIPCGVFNRDGSLYAYAYSYDWSKGYESYDPNQPNRIFVKAPNDNDVKPRKPTGRKK